MFRRWLTLILSLIACPVWAAPVYDTSTTATPVADGSSISVVHTVGGACANPYLIAAVGQSDAAPEAPLTFTTTAGTMTAIHDQTTGGGEQRIDVRRRVGATGAQTVTATFTGVISYLTLGVSSYCDVEQTTPEGTSVETTNFGTAVTVNATSAADELVVDFVLNRSSGETYTPDGSQIQRFQTGGVDNNQTMTSSSETGAATTTMSGTISAGQYWVQVAVPLKPAAAAPSTGVAQYRRR